MTPRAHAGRGFALEDIRVLELANFMAGPYCGMLLADQGADVIKVENPRGGDFTRLAGPFIDGESAGFIAVNRNKRSFALDLKSDRGREIFLSLVRSADVVVENLRPGTLDDLRVGYSVLSEVNPRIILSSTSGFGQTGPYRNRAALDLIVQGMSGIMSITGEEGRPPVKVAVRSEEHTSELQSLTNLVCRLLLEKKNELLYRQHRRRVAVHSVRHESEL